MRDVYYVLMITDPDGTTKFCTFATLDADGAFLAFSEKAPFGGIPFRSKKEAWMHWYKFKESHPDVKGEPKVILYEE